MKTKLMALAAAVVVAFGSWAAPTVTDITAKQRYPWNGLVDISCKVSGIEADAGGYELVAVAVDKDTGKEYAIFDFTIEYGGEDVTGLDVYENGDYKLLWNAREDMGQVVVERMVVRIALEAMPEDDEIEDSSSDARGRIQLWEGGPYFADRNVGATKPWKYGSFFWWGDTKGHRPRGATFGFDFSESNCPTYNKSLSALQNAGWIVTKDGARVLAPSRDAAQIKWGGAWRMPTLRELTDLSNKCDWTWTRYNGVNGYIVRGRGDYASNRIFLPAAGDGAETSLCNSGSLGPYWSSVPSNDGRYSWHMYFNKSGRNISDYSFRFIGRHIRPVCDSAR